MFTGKTKNLGVIGWPVAHSLSPAMQNAALMAARLDYAYIALPVRPEDLKNAVIGLRALNFAGFNVTIPHKQTIMPLLDAIDADAEAIGAVNTVVRKGEQLVGFNTDADGFLSGLHAEHFAVTGKRVIIFGAGGAARAAVQGLLKEKAQSVILGARNEEKAKRTAHAFQKWGDVQGMAWDTKHFEEALCEAQLLINVTPLGMYPQIEKMPPVRWEQVRNDALAYDVVYTPHWTRFLQEAKSHGLRTIHGAQMLVGQGAKAFMLWTGVEANVQVMTKALKEALKVSQS